MLLVQQTALTLRESLHLALMSKTGGLQHKCTETYLQQPDKTLSDTKSHLIDPPPLIYNFEMISNASCLITNVEAKRPGVNLHHFNIAG